MVGLATPTSKREHRHSGLAVGSTDNVAAQKRDSGFPGLFNAFEADAKPAQKRFKVPKVAHIESPPRSQIHSDPPYEAQPSPTGIEGMDLNHDDLLPSSQWRADLHASHALPSDERGEVRLDSGKADELVPTSPVQLLIDLVRGRIAFGPRAGSLPNSAALLRREH